jgi:hypothetical protein
MYGMMSMLYVLHALPFSLLYKANIDCVTTFLTASVYSSLAQQLYLRKTFEELLHVQKQTPSIVSLHGRDYSSYHASLEVIPLLFPKQSLRNTVAHHPIIIFKDWVYWECPCPIPLNPKYVLQFDGFIVTIKDGIVSLPLESIDGTNARHDSVRHVHDPVCGEDE